MKPNKYNSFEIGYLKSFESLRASDKEKFDSLSEEEQNRLAQLDYLASIMVDYYLETKRKEREADFRVDS